MSNTDTNIYDGDNTPLVTDPVLGYVVSAEFTTRQPGDFPNVVQGPEATSAAGAIANLTPQQVQAGEVKE